MKRSAGFTIIEIAVVVVVLGVLSAIAVPKYLNLKTQATISSIQNAAGAIRAASILVHATYLAAGTNPATVSIDGISIAVTNGYADYTSIATAAGLVTGTSTGSYSTATAGTTSTTTVVGTTNTTNCKVTYTNAVSTSAPPVITSPTTSCS